MLSARGQKFLRLTAIEMIEEVHEEHYDEWVLLHLTNGVILCMQQHRSKWFEKLDVVHSPIVDREYGSVLCFKDPDRI